MPMGSAHLSTAPRTMSDSSFELRFVNFITLIVDALAVSGILKGAASARLEGTVASVTVPSLWHARSSPEADPVAVLLCSVCSLSLPLLCHCANGSPRHSHHASPAHIVAPACFDCECHFALLPCTLAAISLSCTQPCCIDGSSESARTACECSGGRGGSCSRSSSGCCCLVVVFSPSSWFGCVDAYAVCSGVSEADAEN